MTAEDYLDDILRLQLKKPKNWQWQLSTSKSSPHISLPVIQLYDAKGNLLLEAKDNGKSQRRSWHSADIRQRNHSQPGSTDATRFTGFNGIPGNVTTITGGLQRCRSDMVTGTKKGHTNEKGYGGEKGYVSEKNGGEGGGRYHRKENYESLDRLHYVRSSSAGTIRCRKPTLAASYKVSESGNVRGKSAENAIIVNGQPKERMHKLRKSRSDVLFNGNNFQTKPNRLYSVQENPPAANNKSGKLENGDIKHYRRHKRSKSDDLFGRKLKYNEESIRRAEMDGYRNFITPHIPPDKSAAEAAPDAKSRARRRLTAALAELVEMDTTPSHMHVEQLEHPVRYTTRTSSAGTLVVEESFNYGRYRRRRRPSNKYVEDDISRYTVSEPLTTPEESRKSSLANIWTRRKSSGPIIEAINDSRKNSETFQDNYSYSNGFGRRYSGGNGEIVGALWITDGAVEEDEEVIKNGLIKDRLKTRKSGENEQKLEWKNGSFSDTMDWNCEINPEAGKGPLIKNYSKSSLGKGGSGGGGGADLLQLVRRLSGGDHHVKMGANVSRHSAKGLSGRRSQSSGSICNGKGRQHNDTGKICSSLPSYLDDRESANGCNNNHHDCEKAPLDEVDRIPPLGDGAPLHWKFSDNHTVLCDQGYGSERSPEEEYPPPLPDHDNQCHHHLEPHACYPFITPESTFVVKLTKGSRGLGLSVTGGIDCNGSWPGLIRIKRLFPHQPASACGLLNVGDLLLEANGITLTGLTNYEALEVLRTASHQVDLKVCRPPPDVLNCVSPISEVPPPPPRREPPASLSLQSTAFSSPEDDYYHGDFEVVLTKIQGSLGFTLRKEDDSALGHYVRALVREPALTDGRIKAGDKIIAVNDVEISPMSHEQAVQFLRQCGDVVKLRLYRDSAQTPVAALSPTETTPRASFSRKAHLRQEAVDMLNDIAVRKLIPGNLHHHHHQQQQQQDTYTRRSLSPPQASSPRRQRRPPAPPTHSSDASSSLILTDHPSSSSTNTLNEEQFHEGLLQQHPLYNAATAGDCAELFSFESQSSSAEDTPAAMSRPSSLELYNPNQTPVAARKPRFNFSLAHNAYELNNLDADVLDAPNLAYNLGQELELGGAGEGEGSAPQEPASMPHIPLDGGATAATAFSYKNPVYQSAHPHCIGQEYSSSGSGGGGGGTTSSSTTTTSSSATQGTTKAADESNIKKWKGVVLSDDKKTAVNQQVKSKIPMQEENEVLAIELNRGWNSRLGFSLQGAAGVTYVSAVHADSVAARDGRLKPGDRVIKVNDESVEHMSTNEIIDLLRIVRGPVCIVVSRIKSNEDCPKSNAAN